MPARLGTLKRMGLTSRVVGAKGVSAPPMADLRLKVVFPANFEVEVPFKGEVKPVFTNP